MKARTSRSRFDERRRFNFVGEEMGRARLDSDANEQAMITRTDAWRRSGDVAEGSPDDGFLVSEYNLLDPVLGLAGWRGAGLPPGDLRNIRMEVGLARRDPESLPQVIRARGVTALHRTFPAWLDLLSRPVSGIEGAATFQAAALIAQIRFDRPPTDDEVVNIRIIFEDAAGQAREVAPVDPGVQAGEWRQISVPLAAFAAFPRSNAPNGNARLLVRGWGLAGLPPRAEIFVDALLAVDDDLPETDLVLRGGDGTVTGAGRVFVAGRRSFIEGDWRYSAQPDLPNPVPLVRPGDLSRRHLLYFDISDRPVHSFDDSFLEEPALAGEPTTFRSRMVTQIRAVELSRDAPLLPPEPMGGGLLTTNLAEGARPNRFPIEDPDPCRDRCLFSENLSSGEGYRGKINAHVRIEILHDGAGLAAPVIAWARDNAAQVSPLIEDAAQTSASVVISHEEAGRYSVDDLVVVEDDWTRLDPGRDGHRPTLRRIRAVDTATGRLEFFAGAEALAEVPAALNVGGPLGRALLMSRHAAVRRWDGADWLLTDVRYNLRDGIAFGFDGVDFRAGEYWSFAARIADPDGGAFGTVDQLTLDPVHGPQRDRAPVGLLEWLPQGRRLIDLRRKFMPLDHVRDRLIELGRRRLSPGAFTVVVGDGVRTFGDIDQNIAEGVHGDEVIQTALARLGGQGGTIYVRAGDYVLEHPVILQARSSVRILGDGPATRLRVTGAGGAFHLDACGAEGHVTIELMRVEETPEVNTPFGSTRPAAIILGPITGLEAIVAGIREVRPLLPADLALADAGPQGLVARLGETLRGLRPGFGRIGASIVRTLEELRRLQRERPGVPLEQSAPDQLQVLQGLPHGVVTVCDSRNVDISRLDILSRAPVGGAGTVAAGVLITGDCANVTVRENRITAPAGIVAVPYARYLSIATILAFPRSALYLGDIVIADNDLAPVDGGRDGISIADGRIDGLGITGNRIQRFLTGITVSDQAENRSAALDRIVVSDNQVVDVPEIGLSLDGDGIDVAANEIRLADLGAGVAPDTRSGIRVTGTGVRVRDCWIALPPSPQNRGPFALEAGIVLGSGTYAPGLPTRPVSDLEVVDTRIQGSGATTLADGIVLAGPTPAHNLRLLRNHVMGLGGSGIRAVGHGGVIGALELAENRIEDVARASVTWSVAATRALADLEPRLANLPANATPRSALERLLALDGPAHVAVDALLRWLDEALLRGGVVLSHVEGAEILRNVIDGVGTRVLPPNFRDPGGEMRTAGLLTMGGRDLIARDNRVANITGVVEPIVFNPPLFLPPGRPPLLDLFDKFRLEPLAPATSAVFVPAASLHKSIAGLRAKVADFALAGGGAVELRSGLRLAVDTVLPSMRAAGGELAVIAGRIAEASEMVSASKGAAEALQAADLLRGAVSDAAGITAPDVETAKIWSVAGSFDRTALADKAVVTEQAEFIARRFEELPKVQQQAIPDLIEVAKAVIDRPGDAEPRRKLSASLGKLALVVETAQTFGAAPAGAAGTPDIDRRLANLRDLSTRLVTGLEDTNRGTIINRFAIAERSVTALLTVLEPVAPDRAARVRAAFANAAAGRRLTSARLTELRDLVASESAAAVAEMEARPVGVFVTAAGGDLAEEVAKRALDRSKSVISVAAKAVDSRIAEAAALDKLDEAFELKLAEAATRQLAELVAEEDGVGGQVDDALTALSRALETDDPKARAEFRERARFSLDALTKAGDVPGAEATTARAIPADRLGVLPQMALEIGVYDKAKDRADGVALFGDAAERNMRALDLSSKEQDTVRSQIAEAKKTLSLDAPSPDALASAVSALASISAKLAKSGAADRAAAPETTPLSQLAQLIETATSTSGTEQDRVLQIHQALGAAPDMISPSLRDGILATHDLAGILDKLKRGVGSITGIPPLILPPPLQPNGFRAHPADGFYCAAPSSALALDGNDIAAARMGIVLAGAADHPLAPTGAQLTRVSVTANRIDRAPISAIDLRPEGTVSLQVLDNAARACAGSADPAQTAYAQAVVAIIGRGELVLNDNRLAGNGNRTSAALLHEILVDWRGDITARGNRIRHAGGQTGGTGLLIVTSDLDARLVGRLSREPALVVEPVPLVKPPGGAKPGIADLFPSFLNAELFAVNMIQATTAKSSAANSFEFGAIELADAAKPVSFTAVTTGPRPAPDIGPAIAAADSWFADLPVLEPVRPIKPILDFIRFRPPIILLPPPRVRRSVQVVANDITAQGPALQILNDGVALISGGVTANELETATGTSAVYLRNLDAVVFTGNRCEALGEVNVAVLRCGNAAVTASSNGLVGDQPAALPPKPLPRPKPIPFPGGTIKPGLSLKLDFGEGMGLSLPLQADALLEGLRNGDQHGVYGQSAREAEAKFKVFAAEKTISPAVRIVNSNLLRGAAGLANADNPPKDEDGAALHTVLSDPNLSAGGKLFGVAKFLQFSDTQARTLVARQMYEAGGDGALALERGISVLAGSGDAGAAVVTKAAAPRALFEEMIGATLGTARPSSIFDYGKFAPVPPPQPPPARTFARDRSLVIIGGARVAAVGNATSAGVYVHPGPDLVLLNV
ncbi:hypothetical protein [Mesorhizobium sp. CN2-181]|uniref:hypothetical protein n=1 Tax=Mesorhizobium yinganensis TaxID=3157707 RepID=UPI0032B723F2